MNVIEVRDRYVRRANGAGFDWDSDDYPIVALLAAARKPDLIRVLDERCYEDGIPGFVRDGIAIQRVTGPRFEPRVLSLVMEHAAQLRRMETS